MKKDGDIPLKSTLSTMGVQYPSHFPPFYFSLIYLHSKVHYSVPLLRIHFPLLIPSFWLRIHELKAGIFISLFLFVFLSYLLFAFVYFFFPVEMVKNCCYCQVWDLHGKSGLDSEVLCEFTA